MSKELIYEKRGKVAYITMNRPEVMNAMNPEVWEGLTEAWLAVRDDPEVWVAIVTGSGERAFSSGADLKALAKYHEEASREGRPYSSPLPEILPMRGIDVWKPIIAAVNGLCIGGGLELALACDFRIATEHARFGLAEVTRGFMPGAGGTQRLTRLVPLGFALEILLTGELIDANKALNIGLVNEVVPSSQLNAAAQALADRLNENAPLAVRAIKQSIYRGLEMPLRDALAFESSMNTGLTQTEDAAEGPKAFAEKRKPIWKGR